MKKILGVIMGIAASALLMVSCNQLAGNGLITPPGEKPVLGVSELTVSIGTMKTSRNIMPDNWNDESSAALTYVLTGSTDADWDGSAEANEVPTDSNANVFSYELIQAGNAKIALKPVAWKFILTAYQDAECTKVALVSDMVSIDLTTGNVSEEFALKPPATTTATGKVNVIVKFPKPSNFNSVEYGIYAGDAPNSAAVSSEITENDATIVATAAELTTVNAETGIYSFNYRNAAVKAGKYHFNAIFKDNAATPNIIGFYSDIIVIDGANTTSKTIDLGNIFNTPAANPTTLSVVYTYDGEAMKAKSYASTDTVPTKYEAKFTWNDKANNELGYELILTNANDADDVLTYNSESTVKDGGLGASSTTVTLELETGKEYTAKICAYNSFTTERTYYSMPESVNVFTVTYNLLGGLVKTSSTNVTDTSVVKYVIPYSKTSTAQTLLSSDVSGYPYIYKTNYNFVKWYESSDTTDMVAVTEVAANNYENLSLNAYWESYAGVTVSFPTYQAIEDLALVSSQAEGSVLTIAGAPTGDSKTTVVTLTPNSGIKDVNWTIYDTDYTTPITENISVAEETKVLTWTITDLDNLIAVPAGTYRVAVTAKLVSDDSDVAGNVYITINR